MVAKIIAWFLCCCCYLATAAQYVPLYTNDTFDIKAAAIYEKKNAIIPFKQAASQFVYILKSERSCPKCFSELYVFLKNELPAWVPIQALSVCDSSIFQIKNFAYENYTTMSDSVKNIFTFYRRGPDLSRILPASVFKTFGVDITPAVVLYNDDQYTVMPFRNLFPSGKFNEQLVRFAIETLFNKPVHPRKSRIK